MDEELEIMEKWVVHAVYLYLDMSADLDNWIAKFHPPCLPFFQICTKDVAPTGDETSAIR